MNGMPTQHSPLGRRFLTVWFGQTVSEIGTMLSGIGAAVFVFVETGSATWLGLLTALAAVPYLVASPFATLIDRYPRRRVMIWADLLAATGPAAALGLASVGRLEIWHLALAGFIAGLGNAFQLPASQAAVPALVATEALDRANSLKQLGPAIGLVAGPFLAAPMVAWWGIEAVLLVDLATFVVGVLAVLAVRFDDYHDDRAVADDGSWRLMWAWLSNDGRPLLTLMAATAVVNFVLAFFNVSVIALSADVAGTAGAGIVLGAGGAAMIAGSVVHAQRGLAPDRVATIMRALVFMSAGLAIAALRPEFVLVTAGITIAFWAVPGVNAATSTIYHERVPASMHGRVFALRSSIGQALRPLGAALAGVTIARVATPSITAGGSLHGTLGRIIGTGPERAPAVVLLACAVVLAALAAWMRQSCLRSSLQPAPAPSNAVVDSESKAEA